jgi:hypothetical protein
MEGEPRRVRNGAAKSSLQSRRPAQRVAIARPPRRHVTRRPSLRRSASQEGERAEESTSGGLAPPPRTSKQIRGVSAPLDWSRRQPWLRAFVNSGAVGTPTGPSRARGSLRRQVWPCRQRLCPLEIGRWGEGKLHGSFCLGACRRQRQTRKIHSDRCRKKFRPCQPSVV